MDLVRGPLISLGRTAPVESDLGPFKESKMKGVKTGSVKQPRPPKGVKTGSPSCPKIIKAGSPKGR